MFASGRSFTVALRAAHGTRFRITGRISAPTPSVDRLTALADGGFLLLWIDQAGRRLLASDLDAAGRFRGRPHLLATHVSSFAEPDAVWDPTVDSDASRAVVVWELVSDNGRRQEVLGAIDGPSGWSGSKVLYAVKSSTSLPIFQLVRDSRDRFLFSLHGTDGSTTAVMWGLRTSSRRWERVTPPQTADGSTLASVNGSTLASVNRTITAAWQVASGALVVSTWDGSSWTRPVTAITGSHLDGFPVAIHPLFVSDGSRAAIVWSKGLLGPVEATIRAGSTGSWSAPLVFPHSRGLFVPPPLTPQDTFWFTASGGLAGVWNGDPIEGSGNGFGTAGLWVGRVGPGGSSATALSRAQLEVEDQGRGWFALPRGDGLTTIVWADARGHEFSVTATRAGVLRQEQPLPGLACGIPSGVASPGAPAQLLLVAAGPPLATGAPCPAVLLW